MQQFDEDSHSVFNLAHIKKTTLFAMVVFSLGYMISEPNLDGFTLQEALDYISNEELDLVPVHIAGFITSFISNIPLLAAILYCWLRAFHQHHHDADCEHSHEHSFLMNLFEFIFIGGPFALMGVAACLDAMGDNFEIKDLTPWQQVMAYMVSGLSGCITAFGAYKLHGFHLHDAMDEHGGGVRGIAKSLYVTFIKNVLAAKNDHSSMAMKIFAVFNEVWKKYGIVGVHGFLGSFAANAFLKETGLGGMSPAFDLSLNICLPMAVMLYEGNTEARSLDSYKERQQGLADPSLFSKIVVSFSGLLHTIPAITAMAMLIGNFESGPLDGIFYNLLVYLLASAVLAYPSIYGFFATTISGFDEVIAELSEKINRLSSQKSAHQYEAINDSRQETLYSRLLTKFGFSTRKEEPIRNYLTYEEMPEMFFSSNQK